MEEQEIIAEVVLLPANKRSNFGIFKDAEDNEIIFSETSIQDNPYLIPQHSYFISTDPNEEIKEGEICLRDYGMGYELVTYKSEYGNTCRKIIVTTDLSLGLVPITLLNWIKDVYVPSNGSIKKVKLKRIAKDISEMVDCYGNVTDNNPWELKLTFDNEVVIIDESKKTKKCQAWYGFGGHDCHTPCDCPDEEDNNVLAVKNQKPKNAIITDAKRFKFEVKNRLDEITKPNYILTQHKESIVEYIKKMYIIALQKGANFCKEKSVNDAIEMLEWLVNNDKIIILSEGVVQHKSDSNKFSKELFESWQQQKTKT